MTANDIKHFLVIYDTVSDAVEIRRFGTDYDAAQDAYEGLERSNANGERYDIVLLSADSLSTIKKTHSSYFRSSSEGAQELILA